MALREISQMNVFKHFRNIRLLENAFVNSRISIPIVHKACLSSLATKFDKPSNFSTDNQTEKEFLVKLKSDPDKFGNNEPEEVITEDDIKEEKYFTKQPHPSQKLSTKKYADLMKNLIGQRKIKEAIDVLEVRMLKEDRVKPCNYLYNLLLGACGRVGYTKKAFMLYNDMKKRGLKVTGGTYTALFNACANSPWPLTDGLTRALKLRNIMIEKGDEPNDTNYNAMIKAFGRCGDLSTAFSLVDEMISKGLPVKDDSINFLLQACITDKEAGFRHSLLVWRKLIKKNIKPSIYTFNLMLKSVRDCGLGDIEVTRNVIDSICNEQKVLSGTHVPGLDQKRGSSSIPHLVAENSDKENTTLNLTKTDYISIAPHSIPTNNTAIAISNFRPNLLSETPHLGNIISLTEVTEPEHRLLLIGGCSGFLETMKKHECTPDIKTFTQLLDCIPSTLSAERDLLAALKKLKIRPDVDFYNMLIKKRSMRCDYESAKEVLDLLKIHNYKPDLVTYGVLALGCKDKEEAMELIEHMKSKSYSLNPEILGAMLHQACYHFKFYYVLYIMELCVEENIQPNKKFMETLEKFKIDTKKLYNEKKLKEELHKPFGVFKARYKMWLQEIQVDNTEDEHPWKQFRENASQEYKYTPKDTARFKPRHNSKFKVKTSTKHRNS